MRSKFPKKEILNTSFQLLSITNNIQVTATKIVPNVNVWFHLDFKFALIFLLFWTLAMWNNGSLKPNLPISYRFQNACLSFLLVFNSSFGIHQFVLCAFHPSLILKYLYVQSGFFSPLLNLLIIFLSMLSDFLDFFIGFEMAQQRRRARILVLRFVPTIAIIQIIDVLRAVSTHAEFRYRVFDAIFTLLIFLGFYFWLYCFCRNKQTENLMSRVVLGYASFVKLKKSKKE
jgi:hypothetical protein